MRGPCDLLDRAITDENYETLGRFMIEAPRQLRDGGCILLFFGTSGDVGHLDRLIQRGRFVDEMITDRILDVRGERTIYFVRRLTLPVEVAP